MLTVVETLPFQKQWPLYWSEEQRGELTLYSKAKTDNITGAKLKEIRRAIENKTTDSCSVAGL